MKHTLLSIGVNYYTTSLFRRILGGCLPLAVLNFQRFTQSREILFKYVRFPSNYEVPQNTTWFLSTIRIRQSARIVYNNEVVYTGVSFKCT